MREVLIKWSGPQVLLASVPYVIASYCLLVVGSDSTTADDILQETLMEDNSVGHHYCEELRLRKQD